jgi:hypothetical protein
MQWIGYNRDLWSLKPSRPQASPIYCGQQLFSDFEEHIMAIPAAKLKEILTADEAALVKASRGPSLAKLSTAELKKHATLARKQYDNWLALGREQSRAKSKKVGVGETAVNTKLKTDAFGEALQAFESQLARADGSAAPKKKAPDANAYGSPKKKRNAGHRATRVEVRQGLSEIKESLKEPARKAAKKKAVKKVAKKKVAEPAASADPKKVDKATKKSAPKSPPVGNPGLGFDKGKVREAKTAAKQSRLDRSGVTTRFQGHVSSRGKRAQGRRDSRG